MLQQELLQHPEEREGLDAPLQEFRKGKSRRYSTRNSWLPRNDTFEIEYKKGDARISNSFKNQKVAIGAVATEGLPDATLTGKAPITYTYNGKPTSEYITKQGTGFVAGASNAIIVVTANDPETDTYAELNRRITIIIGDSASAVNMQEYQEFINPSIAVKPVRKVANSLQASMNGSMLHFTTKNTGIVKVDIYDALDILSPAERSCITLQLMEGQPTSRVSRTVPTR